MSILKKSIIASAALALPLAVSANSKLEKMMKDPGPMGTTVWRL